MRLRANLKTAFAVEPALAAERQAQDKPESGRAQAPRRPNCKIDTLWYQSKLQRQNGSSKIAHSFHCPNCAMIVQTEEPSRQALRVI